MPKEITPIKKFSINVMPKSVFDAENIAERLDPCQAYFVTGIPINADTLANKPASEYGQRIISQHVNATYSYDPASMMFVCLVDNLNVPQGYENVMINFAQPGNIEGNKTFVLSCVVSAKQPQSVVACACVADSLGEAHFFAATVNCDLTQISITAKVTTALQAAENVLFDDMPTVTFM